MKNQKYYINNLIEFVDGARALVFNSFGKHFDHVEDPNVIDELISQIDPEELDEFNQVLSHKESLLIVKQLVKKQKNKKLNKVRYIIDEKSYMEILETLNSRMISNILTKMAADGVIESAFDSELNDFVFWAKDENQK
jgi:DNA-binding HxlR family transcriptional regulator